MYSRITTRAMITRNIVKAFFIVGISLGMLYSTIQIINNIVQERMEERIYSYLKEYGEDTTMIKYIDYNIYYTSLSSIAVTFEDEEKIKYIFTYADNADEGAIRYHNARYVENDSIVHNDYPFKRGYFK